MARHTARSVSLPLESNPIVQRITKELKKLKAWEESSTSKAETLSIGLNGISDLYKCVGQFLSLPLTQQALSMNHNSENVLKLLEASSRLLETCSATKDLTLQLKEASRNLSSSSSHSHQPSISTYFSSRRRLSKRAKPLISSLKRMEGNIFGSKLVGEETDSHLSVVVNILTCVSIISVSILESLISFLGIPASKPRSSLISRLMNHKGRNVCVESLNELESVDLALGALCCNAKADEEDVRALHRRSEALENGIERIENGLDSLFRQLTETRASLLETFLPLESNTIMGRISKELKKLKTWEESSTSAAETISIGLCGIADLYKCVGDMLSSPLTQQSLSLHQHEKCVGELLEACSKLLEVSSATRDTAFQMKEASRSLHSSIKECKESSISTYIHSRKKIIKSTKQTLLSLNRVGVSLGLCSDDDGEDERVSAVIQALRCISIINISIHESALMFLGSKPKCVGKRSLFSKLMFKGKREYEGEEMSKNELENADVAICGLSCESDEKMRLACKRLEALEGGVEGIESGLESVLRQITQTRVSVRQPLESNAMLVRISKELKRLKTWEESSTSVAESISIGLSGIADLYKCICDMLSQQSLSLHKHEKRVGELLEVSSKLLEVCISTRDLAIQTKQASVDLRSNFDLGVSSMLSFIGSRKKIIKSSKHILSSLSKIGGESFEAIGDGDERVSAAIQALKCIIIISISIQETLLLFLATKPKRNGGRSSIFSKLMSKGKGQCDDDEVGRNELENVDVAIYGLSSFHQSDEKLRLARKRLEALENGIQGIESGLDSMFRQLTQTRVMLLKISSSWKNTKH
ncbi:hypothetical protein V2J09_021464 [Rumex salicifolius]